ncbi:MAG: hypothetical protein HOA17_03860 [Candidatus Melainabacteria bacterium]|jgi:hypothetical protein|nr:hypothetical protein [Candidatus Melainabacteria bacterium]
MSKLKILTVIICSIAALPVQAYIGPGMGGGLITATIGVVVAILSSLLGIIYFPIKRFFENRKRKNQTNKANAKL